MFLLIIIYLFIYLYLYSQDQSPSTDASDIYEQVFTTNKSFWDEVNERKLKRKPLERGELNDLIIGSEKKKNVYFFNI